MKKLIFASLALLISSITMSQLNFGVKAGVNYANIMVRRGHGYDHVLDFHAGGFTRYKFNDDIAVQAEVLYSGHGMKGKYLNGTPYEDRLKYISVPVLAQYLAESGFYFEAGPQMGFLLKAKTNIQGAESDKSNYYKKFDFGIAAGAGHLTKSGIGVDARVYFNTMNMVADEVPDVIVRQMVWQLGVFYQFK